MSRLIFAILMENGRKPTGLNVGVERYSKYQHKKMTAQSTIQIFLLNAIAESL